MKYDISAGMQYRFGVIADHNARAPISSSKKPQILPHFFGVRVNGANNFEVWFL
jgi:hypothetical protein